MTASDLMKMYLAGEDTAPFTGFIEKGLSQGLSRGRAEEARALVMRMGRKKFGEPTAEQAAAVEAVTDLPALEALAERLLDANTWAELLAPPAQ